MAGEVTREHAAQIPLLQRRKIERQVLLPVMKACMEGFGEAATRKSRPNNDPASRQQGGRGNGWSASAVA